eukprot:jgi/Pico_ML_1/54331/g4694.t1
MERKASAQRTQDKQRENTHQNLNLSQTSSFQDKTDSQNWEGRRSFERKTPWWCVRKKKLQQIETGPLMHHLG